MRNYSQDRANSDRFIPALCRILEPLGQVKPASDQQDMHEATDLVMLEGMGKRIAARVRGPGFLGKYPNDFTIRLRRVDSRVKTEMDKILEGFADWLIYAHECQSGASEIAAWMIIDLHAFRYHWANKPNEWSIWYEDKLNEDRTTMLRVFTVNGGIGGFPDNPPILIARSQKLMAEA